MAGRKSIKALERPKQQRPAEHVGRGPGQKQEVFAHGYKQIAEDHQSGAPKRYTCRLRDKGTRSRPQELEKEAQYLQRGSLPKKMSNISKEKLLTCHPLMVINGNLFQTSIFQLQLEQEVHLKSQQGHPHVPVSCTAQSKSVLFSTDVLSTPLFSARCYHCSFSQDVS